MMSGEAGGGDRLRTMDAVQFDYKSMGKFVVCGRVHRQSSALIVARVGVYLQLFIGQREPMLIFATKKKQSCFTAILKFVFRASSSCIRNLLHNKLIKSE
jgi:hypothetical protein